MNHDGPWSWRSTLQQRRERTAEEIAYALRVTANKRKASTRARNRREAEKGRAVRAYNNAPLDMRDERARAAWELRQGDPRAWDGSSGSRRRVEAVTRATPDWADVDAMLALYAEARLRTEATGVVYHVDHVVPLQSSWVCGLHCEGNMEVIPAMDNMKKGAKRWPGMPDKLDRYLVTKYRKRLRRGLT